MGWAVGEHDIVVYDEDGLIMGRNPMWVQGTLTTTIWMFYRSILYTNLGKTKSMTCTPGFVWGHMGKDKYKRREMGEGTTFWEYNCTRVIISKFSAIMTESSLRKNIEITHGMSLD